MVFGLSGAMIPRRIRRTFDQRREERSVPDQAQAMLDWRGQSIPVTVGNLSTEGAMILFAPIPHIGEEVALQLVDRGRVTGQIRWVRDGRVGINFTKPLE